MRHNLRKAYLTGFTLVELVTVIAISLVMLTIANLSFTNLGPLRLEGEARRMASDLAWLRQRAVAESTTYTATIDPATDSYVIRNGAGAIVKTERLAADITSVVPGPNQVSFTYPIAYLAARPVKVITLVQQGGGRQRQITFSGETGAVRLQ